MADATIAVLESVDGAAKKVDNESLTVSGNTVYRQRTQIAGATDVAIAGVTNAPPADNAYGLVVRPVDQGDTATVTTFTSTTSGTLLSALAGRVRYTVYNDGDQDLLLLEGSGTASATNFTVRLIPGASWTTDDYTGQVNGIFVSALGSGRALITEIA